MRTPLGLAVGEDGVGVSDITSAYDAEGNTAVTVALTDGSTRSFTVQKGEGATYETATQSADGLMSAADKTKLDNIEAGAEANAIDGVQVNGTALSIAQKIVNLLIVSGASDGAISVNGADVAVTGLAALAYKAEVAYADLAAALKAVIDGHTADLSTLIGSDTGKSVRTIANEELAAQLIPVNAQEALDTLQEISAWIQSHPGEVADINRKLTLGTRNGTEYTTVKAYVEAMVSGLITLSALSANVTGAGNAITGVAYDNTNGAFSFTKGQTFLTEHQDISGKVDKVSGKDLSTNDYTDADKAKVAAALTQHQDISGKVDKVSGKGLSTNDYTDAEKTKLSGIAAQANKTIIDTTLSNAGQAADAKATGDRFSVLYNLISRMEIYCTASGNPATFSDADAVNVKALSVTITPTQEGSGEPSPENVRPISGVSSVSVTRAGRNIYTGASTISGTLSRSVRFALSPGTYTLSAVVTSTDTDKTKSSIALRYDNNTFAVGFSLARGMRSAITFTAIREVTEIWFYASESYDEGVGDSFSFSEIQIERGPAATEFDPYRGQTVTVALTDGGDPLTVYGGTLDVTNGELTVTHGVYTFTGNEMWTVSNEGTFAWVKDSVFANTALLPPDIRSEPEIICEVLAPEPYLTVYNGAVANGVSVTSGYSDNINGRFCVSIDAYNNRIGLTGKKIVYRLAIPVTYQLTPQQLATLSGYNAVSTDAGTVSVTYKADTALALQTGGAA